MMMLLVSVIVAPYFDTWTHCRWCVRLVLVYQCSDVRIEHRPRLVLRQGGFKGNVGRYVINLFGD